MFSLGSASVYQLYNKPTDMRNGFDGLSGIVRNELKGDPLNGEVFIFLNRDGKLIKLLHWQAGGFVLYYKRLEKGTFTPPKIEAGNTQISWPELILMIEGIEVLKQRKKPRYQVGK